MIVIANIKYTKTAFKNKWSQIVKDHNIGAELVTANLKFIQHTLRSTYKWKSIGYAQDFQAKIGALMFGDARYKQRKVKGITVKAFGVKEFIYISQTDILNELFADFSEIGKKAQNRVDVLLMMRQRVKPQIVSFKENWDKDTCDRAEVICPLSGKNLKRKGIKLAVDHDIPFITLAKEFWRLKGLDPCTINVVGGVYDRGFELENLNKEWEDYHRDRSVLQVVEKEANLKKNKKSTEEYLKTLPKAG